MELLGFKLTVSGYPQIFSAVSRRNYASDPRSFRGARTCSRSSITVPSLVGLRFHPPPGWPKTLSFCLSVCLFVCVFVRSSVFERKKIASDFAMKALEYRNDFDAVG